MAQWFFDPFARSRVRGAVTAAATTIPLQPNHGVRFADAPAQIAIWNATLWEDWQEAFYEPDSPVEIIFQNTPAVGDQLQGVTRAQKGTTALDMTDTSFRYKIQQVQTDFVVADELNAGKVLATVDGMEIELGDLLVGDGAWDGQRIQLGVDQYLWVDGSGRLRIKTGSAPSSDTDGVVVGTQT